MRHGLGAAAMLAALSMLAGCTYDYRQRTDRVAYTAGDAVKANLMRETSNPTKASMYRVKGLGKNGPIPSTAEPAE